MKEVSLGIRWEELFGRSKKNTSDATRRARWEQWKDLCLKSDHPEMVEWWGKGSMADDCFSCEHKDGDWCSLQSLPCTVNPVTTFSLGDIGMACRGIGFKPKQTKLEF